MPAVPAELAIDVPRPPGTPLGIRVGTKDTEALPVDAINPAGVIPDWNKSNGKEKQVQVGDTIISVNGVSGSAEKMKQELKVCTVMKLVIKREAPVPKAGDTAPLFSKAFTKAPPGMIPPADAEMATTVSGLGEIKPKGGGAAPPSPDGPPAKAGLAKGLKAALGQFGKESKDIRAHVMTPGRQGSGGGGDEMRKRVDEAENIIKSAREKERDDKLKEAFETYNQGVGCLLEISRELGGDSDLKKEVLEKLEVYMANAELVKERVDRAGR